jgi:formylglycine-generating enzyme required for sulfatase activity
MQTLTHHWRADDGEHVLELVPVTGTHGTPYLFGSAPNRQPTDVGDFHIMSTPVTQALWTHVTGASPSSTFHPRRPVDSISWDGISGPGGFLERINASAILTSLAGSSAGVRFRLPSEAEWEYAARGGPRWRDEFRFSGSNEIDEVGWYCARFSAWRRVVVLGLGWKRGWRLVSRPPGKDATHVHDVAHKKPNQLGLYDMTGNVWEWCEDACGDGDERRLRGGCHHNWDIHCTVSFRYGIARETPGGAIGFRLVLA